MEVDGKPWYLGVAQFNTDGKVKVTESFKDPRAENRHYLIAMGAASMGSMIPKGTQYHPKTKVDMAAIPGRAVNGIRLDKIFYEYGELCLQTNGLARTADSFDQARMWTLTREVDDPSKECTLSILDIGVRAPSTPFRDIGFVNHPEPAYNEAVANIKTVRCFVALVPDVLDSDLQSTGPLINVVNLQDIHPVNGELHIIYLIHRKGKYYTHHIYDNVKLVDVRISLDLEYDRRGDDEWEANRKEAERDHFVNSFQTIVSRDEPRQNESEFGPMDEVNQEYGCSRSVNGENQLVRAIRGFYNEFWKRVIDPMRAKEPEQREMFKRWQPFYSHDYKERHYLTEPLSNFKRHEVHVVRVADYLRECDRTARNTITGSSASTTSRKFLSGVGSVEQAFIGSCRVLLESTMIQVVVPDVRVKCVIYDFEGVANQGTRYYDADSERQAMAYFRQTLDLGLRKGEKIAERLFFPQYVGFSELQGAKCRKKVADREKDIKDGICKGYKWKEGNEVVTMDFAGSITERWFYFVNSVDTEDKVKVGVANLPFNCRAATVHCRSLCEVYLFRGVDSKDWTPLKQWDADLNSAESESSKYQIYGNVWDNEPGRQQVVGIVGGQSKLQVAESSVFLSGDKKMHSVVFFNNVHYEDIARQHKHIPGNMKRVLSVGLCQTGAYSAKATLNRDLNHHVRLLGTPVMDLCKGYPVQGFYRLRRLDCEKVTDSLAHTVENRTNKILSVTKDKRKAVVIPESGNDATGGNPADDQSDNQQITGEPQNEENQPQMSTVAVALSSLSTILAASILSQFH
ncbi:hypothetical protein HDE_03488 [Halotydeus destructor]|nr:hypothetical protein HDE_03488 [Halotydeus destructor]